MSDDFELQSGEGTNIEITGEAEDGLFWLIIDEDKLIEMIQLAFGCPHFKLDHLIDALRAACPEGPEEDTINDAAETDTARALRLAVVQQQYNAGNLTLDEAREILSGPLTPDDESTIYDDSDQLKQDR